MIPFSSGKGKKGFTAHSYEADVKQRKTVKDLPESLSSNLYGFQKLGIEYGLARFGRLLLGDEMGVGKTIQAIGISYVYKADWPLLIIAPSTLRHTWKDEFKKWIPSMKDKDIQMFKTGKDEWSPDAFIFIMSYDLATKRQEELQQRKFKMCIADEAHYLKSRDSKRS